MIAFLMYSNYTVYRAKNKNALKVLELVIQVTAFLKALINGEWRWKCPDGYHSAQDDETGQCYPDTEPCYPGHLIDPDTTNCRDEEDVCEEFNLTGCMEDGKMIDTFPNEDCLRYPDNEKCAAIMIKDVKMMVSY
jgi:hypothetical protein